MTVVHHLISLLMRAERHPGAPLCWGWEQVAHAAVRMQLHVSGSLKTCSGNTRVSWAPLSWGGGRGGFTSPTSTTTVVSLGAFRLRGCESLCPSLFLLYQVVFWPSGNSELLHPSTGNTLILCDTLTPPNNDALLQFLCLWSEEHSCCC